MENSLPTGGNVENYYTLNLAESIPRHRRSPLSAVNRATKMLPTKFSSIMLFRSNRPLKTCPTLTTGFLKCIIANLIPQMAGKPVVLARAGVWSTKSPRPQVHYPQSTSLKRYPPPLILERPIGNIIPEMKSRPKTKDLIDLDCV